MKLLRDACLVPRWSVHESVVAFVTTRQGGHSRPPYDSFNLGLHVGDDARHVGANRERLLASLPAGFALQWLDQVHGTQLVDARADGVIRTADAVYIDRPEQAGVVMTADCLPVFFAAQSGARVALAHAGWRGLLDGILENTLARFPDAPEDLATWFGPAIGPCHFEVGAEVRDAFLATAQTSAMRRIIGEEAFSPAPGTRKYFADLYRLAALRLQASGVRSIGGAQLCTYCDSRRFYSYRRDGTTGRFASVIGLTP